MPVARSLPASLLVLLLPVPFAVAEEESPRTKIVLTNVSEAAGVGGLAGDRFSFGDYDADGDPDLLINGRTLLRNDSTRADGDESTIRFTDVSRQSGMRKGPGGGACWVDIDGDGDLDAVTQHGGLKLQVQPGIFEDRAVVWGLPKGARASTVGVGDLDGDRRPDVLFGGGEDWNDGNAKFYPRRLYRNVEGKRLQEVTDAHDLRAARYGRAVVWADFDRDGDQDVYLGNYRLQPNELLVNERGVLEERGAAHGVQGRHEPEKFLDERTKRRFGYQWGHTIASSWADLDGDGDLDLWVSNLVHKFVGDTTLGGKKTYDIRGYICDDSAIYENRGAPHYRFHDVRAKSGVAPKPIGDRDVYQGDELWSHAACGDLDGDGLPEVFITQVYQLPYAHTLLYRNKGALRFEEISGVVGVRRFNSYGGAFADLDGDGDLDLVCGGSPTPKGKRSLCVLRNDTAPGPWVAIDLEGATAAKSTLGAQVTVVTDRGALVRQIESCMGSHAQQNERTCRFGLRDRKVLSAYIRWPGGLIQDLPSLKQGQRHTIQEPDRSVPSLRIQVPDEAHVGKAVAIALPRDGVSARWTLSVDTSGDGTFRPVKGDSLRATPEDALTEIRVRLSNAALGLHREHVLRIHARPAQQSDE